MEDFGFLPRLKLFMLFLANIVGGYLICSLISWSFDFYDWNFVSHIFKWAVVVYAFQWLFHISYVPRYLMNATALSIAIITVGALLGSLVSWSFDREYWNLCSNILWWISIGISAFSAISCLFFLLNRN